MSNITLNIHSVFLPIIQQANLALPWRTRYWMWSWKGPSTWPCQQTWARLWSNPSTCRNLSERSVTGDDCPRITHFTITKLCFRKIELFHNALSMIYHEICFPAHFRHLSIQFTKNQYAFSISSRTLWNVRMLVSILTLVDQFWNIIIQFRALSVPFSSIAFPPSVTVFLSTRQQNKVRLLAFISVKVSLKIVS